MSLNDGDNLYDYLLVSTLQIQGTERISLNVRVTNHHVLFFSKSCSLQTFTGERGEKTIDIEDERRRRLGFQVPPKTWNLPLMIGRKLVFESERAVWACANRVIGCGFEPAKKRVFFTVDANLTHVIRCTSEAYGSPLYPVLAADSDAMLLVNLGQAPFKYAPANAARTQNPCFIRHPSADAGGGQPAGSVDSRELFSVSRMEAEWLERDKRSQRRNNSNSSSNSKKSNGNLDDNYDAESDLFEISLQG